MTVLSATDIIMGVVRAADPREASASLQRLAKVEADPAGTAELNSLAIAGSVKPGVQADAAYGHAPQQTITANLRDATRFLPGQAQTDKAQQDFEAFILQSFVEAMLPESANEVYGTGTAGKIWKSYLAEAVSREIAGSATLRLLPPAGGYEAEAQI